MIYSVEIDDQNKTGKSLISLLQDLAKTSKGIRLMDTIKDDELLSKMLLSKKSSKASKQEVMKTIKEILAK